MIAQMCEKMAKVQKNTNGCIDCTSENTHLFDSAFKTLTQINQQLTAWSVSRNSNHGVGGGGGGVNGLSTGLVSNPIFAEDIGTIGGISTLSQTTSVATDARRAYLEDASKDKEQTNEGERAVAKWLVEGFLADDNASYLGLSAANVDDREISVSESDVSDNRDVPMVGKKKEGITIFFFFF
ncbi:hypothetical protein RFI_31092 [Reticulomyxa filosa]|uniref:Uncharacterized protein n=1 Tax=Reticulomyxa filosa TaxID=46433 RepID=X6LWJ8_RETFI|nr:hypothetical protein RFI_31092 [Reticulomyxa filosa]|eukprot:ETO06303.1 hypothetical protein RFI_31092 [Reticulomyxa filosa]